MAEIPESIEIPLHIGFLEQPKTMDKWEYRYAPVDIEALNELGAVGWQVVIAIQHLPGTVLMIRQIIDPPLLTASVDDTDETRAEPVGDMTHWHPENPDDEPGE